MPKLPKNVYLDHAATTPTDPVIGRLIASTERKYQGNASTLHSGGIATRKALEGARGTVATVLCAHLDEVIFTSGGTEGDNMVILGIARKQKNKKR
jgi:cysteine desulfurase